MITDGFLTHGAAESVISTFQFTSPIVHAFLVAFLTTILSYQAASILIDLCLGLKKRGIARLTDLAILHFSDQGSVLAVCTALLNTRFLTRLRYHGLFHQTTCTTPVDAGASTRLSPRVAAKLMALLLATPAINLAAVALSLERDQSLTFSEAQFGGIALGITGADELLSTTFRSANCRQPRERYPPGDFPAVEFMVCTVWQVYSVPVEQRILKVSIIANPNGLVAGRLAAFDKRNNLRESWVVNVVSSVKMEDEVRILRQRVDEQSASGLMRELSAYLSERCKPLEGAENDSSAIVVGNKVQDLTVSQTTPCGFLKNSDIRGMFELMTTRVTLVEAKTFEILESPVDIREEPIYTSGDDLLLLRRRRPQVSLFALLVTVSVVIVLRLGVKLITCNDTSLGLELVVKSAVGMKCFDSMLQNREKVDFFAEDVHREDGDGEGTEIVGNLDEP